MFKECLYACVYPYIHARTQHSLERQANIYTQIDIILINPCNNEEFIFSLYDTSL